MRKLLLLMVLCALGVLLFASVATATSSAMATSSATATATASAAGAAQYQYASASALPGTGGVSPVTLLAIIPAILLVGGGLLSARLIRRS